MRRMNARMGHVMLEGDPHVLFLEEFMAWLPPQALLYRGSAAHFRKRHDALLDFFGVPSVDGAGITPASHRGGGTTWRFFQGETLSMIRWRGRWTSDRSLEIYLQEVGAASILPSLKPADRDRISRFAQSSAAALVQAAARLREKRESR